MEDKNKLMLVGAAIAVFIILFSYKQPDTNITNNSTNLDMQQYLIEEPDFDYNSPEVASLSNQLKMASAIQTPGSQKLSPTEEAEMVKKIIKYVAQNIKYSGEITPASCYAEKASTVLTSRRGDCVSMSRLVTALLRAQGIPARTMGGCLSSGIRCSPLMAVVPGAEAQTTEMIAGDFKKRGFLHEYVEYFDSTTNKWQIIEATSGNVFPRSCATYLDFGYDTNNIDRCVINSQEFWNACKLY